MLSFIAVAGTCSYCGAWPACIDWCRRQAADHPQTTAHVLLARGGEKHGRVVAEVTADGERRVRHGRHVPLKRVATWR